MRVTMPMTLEVTMTASVARAVPMACTIKLTRPDLAGATSTKVAIGMRDCWLCAGGDPRKGIRS